MVTTMLDRRARLSTLANTSPWTDRDLSLLPPPDHLA